MWFQTSKLTKYLDCRTLDYCRAFIFGMKTYYFYFWISVESWDSWTALKTGCFVGLCLHCPHRGCEPNEKEQRTGGKRKQLLKYRSKIKILVGTQWFLHALWIVKSSRNCIFYKKVLWLYSFWLILQQLFFIFKFSAIFLTSLFKKTENFLLRFSRFS